MSFGHTFCLVKRMFIYRKDMHWIASALVYPICGIFIYYVLEVIYKLFVTSRGSKRIPCGPLMPILGNVWIFFKAKTLSELHQRIADYMPNSPICAFWILNKLVIPVVEPKYVDAIIAKTWASQKDKDIYEAFTMFSDGMFTRYGDGWARLRRPFMNFVHPKFIDSWMDVFSKRAQRLCDGIGAQSGPFEVVELTRHYTLDLVCETQMGTSVTGPQKAEFLDTLSKVMAYSLSVMLSPAYRLGIGHLIYGSSPPILETSLNIPLFIVQKRIRALKEKGVDITTIEPTCYTDIVLQAGAMEGADEKQMAKIGVDMMVAGADTTGTALASAILFLAIHPQYQEKLYNEIRETLGGSDRIPTDTDLKKMVYLDMIINETIRISGVPGIARTLDKEANIDGYIIPKGSTIFFRFMLTHRDPRWWKRPKDFFPDHFLPEEVAARPKGAFTPFSAGPRNCPGQLYAMISMKTALAAVIRRFKFSTDLKFSELTYKFDLMQEPDCTRVTASPR